MEITSIKMIVIPLLYIQEILLLSNVMTEGEKKVLGVVIVEITGIKTIVVLRHVLSIL